MHFTFVPDLWFIDFFTYLNFFFKLELWKETLHTTLNVHLLIFVTTVLLAVSFIRFDWTPLFHVSRMAEVTTLNDRFQKSWVNCIRYLHRALRYMIQDKISALRWNFLSALWTQKLKVTLTFLKKTMNVFYSIIFYFNNSTSIKICFFVSMK